MTLIFVALAAGLIAGISPCILPVLPIVFVAGVAAPDATVDPKASWRRSVAIVLGLVVAALGWMLVAVLVVMLLLLLGGLANTSSFQ